MNSIDNLDPIRAAELRLECLRLAMTIGNGERDAEKLWVFVRSGSLAKPTQLPDQQFPDQQFSGSTGAA